MSVTIGEIPAERLPPKRRARVLGERARIARLSPIRELALGFQDGRVTGTALMRSGAQVFAVGGGSAAIGFAVGAVVPKLL
jgi:hypothetical protein